MNSLKEKYFGILKECYQIFHYYPFFSNLTISGSVFSNIYFKLKILLIMVISQDRLISYRDGKYPDKGLNEAIDNISGFRSSMYGRRFPSSKQFAADLMRTIIPKDINVEFNMQIGPDGKSKKPTTTEFKESKPKTGEPDKVEDKPQPKKSRGNGNRPRSNQPKNDSGSKGTAGYPQEARGSSSEIYFRPGLKSGAIFNPFETSRGNYSTCFLMSGSFFPNDSNNTVVREIVDDVYYRTYLRLIQSRANVPVDKSFSKQVFFRYFAALTNALQLYYMVDSICAHCEDPDIRYKNLGIQNLRDQLDWNVLSQQAKLHSILVGMPIPPNLLNFIRFMYQNFSLSNEHEFPVIRLGFRHTLYDTTKGQIDADYYAVIIDELNNTDFHQLIGYMLKNIRSMITPKKLPESYSGILYSKEFITFWTNSSVTWLNPATQNVNYSRSVKSDREEINYWQFTDEPLDGMFYSLQSVLLLDETKNTSSLQPGLWSPANDQQSFKGCKAKQRSSLLRFSSSNRMFISPNSVSNCSQANVYHSVYFNSTDESYNDVVLTPPGCRIIQSNNIANTHAAVYESINYLMLVI